MERGHKKLTGHRLGAVWHFVAPPKHRQGSRHRENATPHDEELHGGDGVTHEQLPLTAQPKILNVSA